MNHLFIRDPVVLPSSFGGSSAGYIAFKLMEQLAPMLVTNGTLVTIPGGLHIEAANLDVILDLEEAMALENDHPMQSYSELNSVSVLMIVDTSFSLSASACIRDTSIRCFTDLRPWSDSYEPHLTMVGNARRSIKHGDVLCAVVAEPDQHISAKTIHVDDVEALRAGFNLAEARLADWRAGNLRKAA